MKHSCTIAMLKNNYREAIRACARNVTRVLLEVFFPASARERRVAALTGAELASRIDVRSVANTIVLFHYHDPPIKDLVWLLKYRGNKKAAELLGNTAGDYLLETLADEQTFRNFKEPLFIPMPLSRKRKRERGFNQAERLAEAILAHISGIRVLDRKTLIKHRDTPPQTSLSRKERLVNPKGAFAADSAKLAGRNVILIDDVVTTGSTMREARRALKKAGVRRVLSIAIAS